MRLVVPELERLIESAAPGEAAMARKLLDLAQTMSIHDQMIFVGD
jgi:hypothetical protein